MSSDKPLPEPIFHDVILCQWGPMIKHCSNRWHSTSPQPCVHILFTTQWRQFFYILFIYHTGLNSWYRKGVWNNSGAWTSAYWPDSCPVDEPGRRDDLQWQEPLWMHSRDLDYFNKFSVRNQENYLQVDAQVTFELYGNFRCLHNRSFDLEVLNLRMHHHFG